MAVISAAIADTAPAAIPTCVAVNRPGPGLIGRPTLGGLSGAMGSFYCLRREVAT